MSCLERGEIGGLRVGDARAIASSLGIRLTLRPWLSGGDIDRVVNAAHARLHEQVARLLDDLGGWARQPVVTFSIYGERGIIDILAWHAPSRSILIIELKTRLVDPQDLAATMDRRRRLGRRIAAEHGWQALTVSTWVIVAETSSNRRRLARHERLLRSAFPATGRDIRRWLRHPQGRIDALSFLSQDPSWITCRSQRRHDLVGWWSSRRFR